MKNLILFGAGFFGKNAYHKLKKNFRILCFVDNNPALEGKELYGVPIILGSKLCDVYNKDTEVVVCAQTYMEIGVQLAQMGISGHYVMIQGFLYHNDEHETMAPVEWERVPYYKKANPAERNILFLQDVPCIRTHKIASMMKDEGYRVFLLYTFAPIRDGNSAFAGVYDGIWGFYSMKGIVDYIENSDFDIIHSSNWPDVLTNLAVMTSTPVVFDTHDMNSIWRQGLFDEYIVEHIANTYSDGNIYVSESVRRIAEDKYCLRDNEIFVMENYPLEQDEILSPYEKLSAEDGEIHCVYEGGVTGADKDSDRYFEEIWVKIASGGVHIHFYSPADTDYCKYLESKSKYIHYQGNMGSKELAQEMTKYDCGLVVYNVTEKTKVFHGTLSPNKIYEYLNSRLPVVVGNFKNYADLVKQYDVGVQLDLTGNIKAQIREACSKKVSSKFLTEHGLTMKSYQKDLAKFYERVKAKKLLGKDP